MNLAILMRGTRRAAPKTRTDTVAIHPERGTEFVICRRPGSGQTWWYSPSSGAGPRKADAITQARLEGYRIEPRTRRL